MRTLSAAELAALQRSSVPMAALVDMWLPGTPLCLNTGGIDLQVATPADMAAYYAGLGVTLDATTTYYGARGLGSIAPVRETPSEFPQLQLELSGVTSEIIAVALGTAVQGKPIRIRVCIFDPDTYQAFTPRTRWAGRLDLMSIVDAKPSPVIQVTAEHAGVDLLRATNRIYSDADQRLDYPSDPSLQFVSDQVEQRIVWPAASWGKQ